MIKQRLLFPEFEFKEYKNSKANKLFVGDQPFHDWYRFVLSFPPHLVREYIERFELKSKNTLLDPFCGTGTTLVEAKLHHLRGIGIEANKMAHFACHVKCNWNVDATDFFESCQTIAKRAKKRIAVIKRDYAFSEEQFGLILKDSIDPVPLHRTLILREIIEEQDSTFKEHQLLALATSTVRYCSNLHFGPEVGVSQKKKIDSDAVECWLSAAQRMYQDLLEIKRTNNKQTYHPSVIHFGDSRNVDFFLEKKSIDAVFTSPPYPNEKDYTRTTRLESVLLGFLNTKSELREMKEGLLRSNTRNVYKDDKDDEFILHNKEVMKIADEIEKKRIQLGKTSGFEKQYHRVVRLYFGGMARHLESLKPFLKKGAMLGYVVGDQASFLQVYIPTGKILGEIAVHLGYKLESIELFRTRFATATKKEMNEEVVVLKWEE